MQLVNFSTTILLLAFLLATNAFPVSLSDSLSELELHQSGSDNTVSLVARNNKPVVNKPLPKPSTPSTAPKTSILGKIKDLFSRDTDAVLEVRFNKPVVSKPMTKPTTPSTVPRTRLRDKIKNIFSKDGEVEAEAAGLMGKDDMENNDSGVTEFMNDDMNV
ncbi:hypothetical protein HYFRA_00004811 [Hymenoscyphus fraxineus]|uniref:Uncharacterized protein n=1 Tax=Hymenoscyphus fraxineus TaxID=746836 RepID=A0A9N9KLH7_9HELO|nr:hypothetical protein HYFRA_00004811 [Hymenoscyphus fraxineus]